MSISARIVSLPRLKIRDSDGFTNVLLAQPGFAPHRAEESGYGPSIADCAEAERFVDECLTCVAEERQERRLVVFPEAFVPLGRVQRLREFMRTDCPPNTVIVAGMQCVPIEEALVRNELPIDEVLRQEMRDAVARRSHFLNACLVLVRDGEGADWAYLQPKLHPSDAEQSLPSMFSCNSVLLFTSPQLAFMVLICSDLIQRPPPEGSLPVSAVNAVKRAWDASGPATSLPVDLIINIQCNPKPNHQLFREGAKSVLCHRTDTVRLDAASVLISNWGNLWDKLEPLLASGIIYQTAFWRPPSDAEPNVPVGYSFTADETNGINIVAFRSLAHGRCRFQMAPSSQADRTDASRKLPLKNSEFETRAADGRWVTTQLSAWRDRCNRWLPERLPGSSYDFLWSVPHSQQMQREIFAKYTDTRRRILEKSDTDLRDNLLCLMLSSQHWNPDLWREQQRMALCKWSSIATLFHFSDDSFEFGGAEWFSFRWRREVCIALVDGEGSVPCQRSVAIFDDRFGSRLPRDPDSPVALVLLLYRHIRDGRADFRRIAPFAEEACDQPRAAREGARREALAENPEDITTSRVEPRLFWASADCLDAALEASDKASLQAILERICGPALD